VDKFVVQAIVTSPTISARKCRIQHLGRFDFVHHLTWLHRSHTFPTYVCIETFVAQQTGEEVYFQAQANRSRTEPEIKRPLAESSPTGHESPAISYTATIQSRH